MEINRCVVTVQRRNEAPAVNWRHGSFFHAHRVRIAETVHWLPDANCEEAYLRAASQKTRNGVDWRREFVPSVDNDTAKCQIKSFGVHGMRDGWRSLCNLIRAPDEN